ncbi:MAG: C45 family peptidase [Candidatus Thermoplasmatota archaeon]
MKKMVFVCLVVFLFLASVFSGFSYKGQHLRADGYTGLDKFGFFEDRKDIEVLDFLDGSRVEIRDGVKIVYLNGSYYEMGYQFACLLEEQYLASRRAWMDFLPYSFEELLQFWYDIEDKIPVRYKDEIQGRADALDLSFEEVAIMEVIGVAMYKDEKCSGFAAWGPATEDGRLYHFRSCDGSLSSVDPVTGMYASDDQLLIVRNPEEGYSSVVIGLSVEVGADAGFNEKKIGVGYSAVSSSDVKTDGVPSGIRKRMLLEEASNLEEAVDIYNMSSTCGWNLIISDGDDSSAVVVEDGRNYSKVCRWNDSCESNYPSWEIDHVLRRGNFFLNPVEAGFEEDVYNKSGFFRYFLSLLGFETPYDHYGEILHFNVMSRAIEDRWGNLGLNSSMEMMRSVYRGETNFFYGSLKRFIPSLYVQTWNQWTFCPETGELVVSFSDRRKTAFLNPVHYFNLYELMDKNFKG